MPNSTYLTHQHQPPVPPLLRSMPDLDRPNPDPRIDMLRQVIEGLGLGLMDRAAALQIVEAAGLGGRCGLCVPDQSHNKTQYLGTPRLK